MTFRPVREGSLLKIFKFSQFFLWNTGFSSDLFYLRLFVKRNVFGLGTCQIWVIGRGNREGHGGDLAMARRKPNRTYKIIQIWYTNDEYAIRLFRPARGISFVNHNCFRN